MIPNSLADFVVVSLPRQLAGALLCLRSHLDDDCANVLRAALGASANPPNENEARVCREIPSAHPDRKYTADFLGTRVTAWTLPEIFAHIVDLTADVAPEALEMLATMRARTRRFVARSPELVHPGRRDLLVMRTKSGWWVSRNIGREDLMRALRALAQAAGLEYGEDVRLLNAYGR